MLLQILQKWSNNTSYMALQEEAINEVHKKDNKPKHFEIRCC